MKDIHDHIALVTGGASGIGKLMAIELAMHGARVVVWDLNEKAMRDFSAEAETRGLKITGMKCDVSSKIEVYAKAKELTKNIGPVDILINNAGVVSGKTFLETDDSKIELTMAVNTMSLFWTAKAFLPSMIERNRGHIVTISSAAGILGVTGLADYSASKFAAFGFTEAIRTELKRIKSKVRTTVVCPFFIDTGMFSGVRTRFPLLLPILKSDKAAKRIIGALLRNRQRLIMPPMVYSVFLLRMFPVVVFDAVADFFGISRSMDHFTERPQ